MNTDLPRMSLRAMDRLRLIPSLDRLGGLLAVLIALALFSAPFVTFRANRIAEGEGHVLAEALPLAAVLGVSAVALGVAFVAAFSHRPPIRILAAATGLAVLLPAAGWSAGFLTPPSDAFARVSPSFGFWLLALAFSLLGADALTRLRPGPWMRLAVLAAAAGGVALLLRSGVWDGLSLFKEYAVRAESFRHEAGRHLWLALGSMGAACLIGLPLGFLGHRRPAWGNVILQVLNVVQTVPSIALFGILMVPLGILAANVPLAASLGIRGIGAAPAFIALFLYSLLPVVANAVTGLRQVPAAVVDAARGMGLSSRQRLFQVELPLALPTILAGIRIALVQNLGLATIAALIGGGGFGTFVFQGLGQGAIDLVLLGTLPTVALSFAAAVVLDAVIDLTKRGSHDRD